MDVSGVRASRDALPGVSGDEYALRDFLQVVRRRLGTIALVVALVAGAAVVFSLLQTPEYEASIKILVGQERGITETPGDVLGLQQVTQTMAEAVASRPVAEEVIRRLDLRVTPEEFLEERLSVEQIDATQFIRVDYRGTDPERVREVADATGEVFSEQVSGISAGANTITATVWERAVAPDEPVSPNYPLNVAVALALGLMLGIGLAFLMEYLDDSWRSPEEVEQVSGVPTFGVIPEFGYPKKGTRSKKGEGDVPLSQEPPGA